MQIIDMCIYNYSSDIMRYFKYYPFLNLVSFSKTSVNLQPFGTNRIFVRASIPEIWNDEFAESAYFYTENL